MAWGTCSEGLVFEERGEWGKSGWILLKKSVRRVFLTLGGVLDSESFSLLVESLAH